MELIASSNDDTRVSEEDLKQFRNQLICIQNSVQ